ncbi:MAG: inactive transglutaminase family protein [Gammaproteobacteria bacterium]|nr:inactive transglutaminase family protein [Gammaproteobacteria bacterium]
MKKTPSETRNLSLIIIVGLLLGLGLGQAIHRHFVYEVPWFPGDEKLIWSIEARIQFSARGDAVSVSLRRPSDQADFSVLDETGASPGYGLSFLEEDGAPLAQWTIREADGRQTLFYRVQVLQRDSAQSIVGEVAPAPSPPNWEEPYRTAVDTVLDEAVNLSADPFSLTRRLINQFNSADRGQNEQLLLDNYGRDNLSGLLANMLQSRDIQATTAYGLMLEDGRRRQRLRPLLRVWSGDRSETFPLSLAPDERQLPILLWQPTDEFVLDVTGGFNSDLSFSMLRAALTDYGQVAGALGEASDWLGFSIHALPVEEQAMFQTILLLPIGALVVCILRILVGIRTSGTFMPILIALAFIQTTLVTGLVGFLLVVAVGLMIRSYMSHLNLLLVARISAVIITVITIIGLFSIFSYQVGLTEGLKITFFPLIILSWTVERMSILWEEEGWHEVAVQGFGSLITAIAAYLAMTNPLIRHLSFNFVGLQFVALALIMLLGSYSGYRLLELRRFSPFSDQS